MSVRIACAQVAPKVGDGEGNRAAALVAVREAVGAGARIVLLPELVTSGYVFESADEARALAQPVDGPALSEWADEAARARAVIVGGFAELGEDGGVYNSAAVVGPDELLAVYRKTHLWGREQLCFEPGAEAAPVVETPFGRIGIAVCYDLYFPELTRGLALAGADLVAVPANLPLFPRPEGGVPGRDRARPGDCAREQGLGRSVRPHRARARGRVDGRELHRRPGRLARRQAGRWVRRGDPVCRL